jgi:hypothetical protein
MMIIQFLFFILFFSPCNFKPNLSDAHTIDVSVKKVKSGVYFALVLNPKSLPGKHICCRYPPVSSLNLVKTTAAIVQDGFHCTLIVHIGHQSRAQLVRSRRGNGSIVRSREMIHLQCDWDLHIVAAFSTTSTSEEGTTQPMLFVFVCLCLSNAPKPNN